MNRVNLLFLSHLSVKIPFTLKGMAGLWRGAGDPGSPEQMQFKCSPGDVDEPSMVRQGPLGLRRGPQRRLPGPVLTLSSFGCGLNIGQMLPLCRPPVEPQAMLPARAPGKPEASVV